MQKWTVEESVGQLEMVSIQGAVARAGPGLVGFALEK